ncbi:hypothetical protein [Paenibacillus sanguinis]|uniref:hypothetical protein n=1 Tax=Paenibacillus sanguinis TaxID=225906 RepID=UPI00036B1EE8|nr:hypothetical protein [Paenibacillus sanguinis]
MSHILSKVTAALLAVLLLFAYPALQTAQREEDIRYLAAYQAMVQFADAVRNKGFISSIMYEEFIRQLEVGGGMHEVELEHRRKKYHPEYGDPANPNTFLNEFSVVYDAYYSPEILSVLFPGDTAGTPRKKGRYKLQTGDYFSVTLTNRSRGPMDIFSDFLYGSPASQASDLMMYGGMVLNEDY